MSASSTHSFIQAHQVISTLVAYYMVNAAIDSMPAPDATSGKFYVWFYKFASTAAANLTRVFANKLPSGSR